MKTNLLSKNTLLVLVLLVVATAVSMAGFFYTDTASAGATDSMTGYAWSDNIGWISMNNTNNGGAINYGVDVSSSGDISGYAWSDNIGWITFNAAQLSSCPGGGSCAPTLDWTTGVVSGWARACAGTTMGDCSTSASRTDGWDGWISLSGVTANTATGALSGFAWGSTVVGWVDFSFANAALPPVSIIDFYGNGCIIPLLASTCNGNVTWNIAFATTPNVINITTGVPHLSIPFATSSPIGLQYGVNTIQARDGAAVLGSIDISAVCDTTTQFWDGTKCGLLPVLSVSADPTIIRSGQNTVINNDITSNYDLSCTLHGANLAPDTFRHLFGSGVNQIHAVTSRNLSAEQIATLVCTVDVMPTVSVTSEGRIEVIGGSQEI